MKVKSLITLLLFQGCFYYSQAKLNSTEKFYKEILDFVVEQYDIDSVGNGLQKIKFEKKSTSFSADRRNIIIEYILPNDAKLLLEKNASDTKTNKIYLLHKIDISYFLMNYLSVIAYTYEVNKIWYNKNKTIIITYELKDNTVGILEVSSTR